jgi:hypothetical protein
MTGTLETERTNCTARALRLGLVLVVGTFAVPAHGVCQPVSEPSQSQNAAPIEAAAPLPTGVLELEIAPAEATLKLDGSPAGNANGFRRELPAGKHTVEISAPGYRSVIVDIGVKPGATSQITFSLVAALPPQVVKPRPVYLPPAVGPTSPWPPPTDTQAMPPP